MHSKPWMTFGVSLSTILLASLLQVTGEGTRASPATSIRQRVEFKVTMSLNCSLRVH